MAVMKDNQGSLFYSQTEAGPGSTTGQPLADRMRPRTLDEFVGQEKLTGAGRILRRMIEDDQLISMIFWGPPGSGKTTLARIIAASTRSNFINFSAVLSGIKEIKSVMAEAESCRRSTGRRTVLFIDEIHRFNKAQQDAFLPYVESGTIVLIGATTENPSFEVNSALLSRVKVFVLEELSTEELVTIMKRALQDNERGLGKFSVEASDELLRKLATYASGDARVSLNTLEIAVSDLARQQGKTAESEAQSINTGKLVLTEEAINEALSTATLRYDKAGEEHFNLISAFIKSIRNSDVDAALYWLARMLEAGEDPLYVARRLVHHASEDIGLADPNALTQAVAAMQAAHFIGLPECKLALAQATIYLALAPKSNSVIAAYMAAAKDVAETEREAVPLHLRNAPTSLMKRLGYGKGYLYAHDFEAGKVEMDCLPEKLKGRKYYRSGNRGWEAACGKTVEK